MPASDQSPAGIAQSGTTARHSIRMRGVRVHNLKNVDLDLPLHKLIVITGVSGSGKSSLAFDTLAVEGQRRYIESFSTYARQFLERLERPDADRIDHIPPSIAIAQHASRYGRRSTVATGTEISEFLKLLYARIGRIFCPECNREVRQDTPNSVRRAIESWPAGTRFEICFPLDIPAGTSLADVAVTLKTLGFTRLIADGRTLNLADAQPAAETRVASALVVVDRLVAGKTSGGRLGDSLELAFKRGNGRCEVLRVEDDIEQVPDDDRLIVDAQPRRRFSFSRRLRCELCGRDFPELEPRLFSFNSPLGACPTCSGFGMVPTISFERVVPNPTLSLREGAIAPWTTPAYKHELDELLALAPDYGLPTDIPFRELSEEHRALIRNGVPARKFGGLNGFFKWLERHAYKVGVRVLLSRLRTYVPCPDCHGTRFQPLALAVRAGGRNVAEFSGLSVAEATEFCARLRNELDSSERALADTILDQIVSRLNYLVDVGLDYLTLDRGLRTLSSGELQRLTLTSAFGTKLVNTLYVLDEPSRGLHARDHERMLGAIQKLRDLRNTAVIVEHEEIFIRNADRIVDIGPGAGSDGGRIVFQGTIAELAGASGSLTGEYLSGKRRIDVPPAENRRKPSGWVKLSGVTLNNLRDLNVDFPLGVLCAVTGVSGSGKTSLVSETLYPALCRALVQPCSVETTGSYRSLDVERTAETRALSTPLDEVLFVDQSPIGRTPRSNPVTYLKGFQEIRAVFAECPESKLRNFNATSFSFNSARGGRCPVCQGNGTIEIDMQFLADVAIVCPECHGKRYQIDILQVKYRGLDISEVLAMTVRDAIAFFRGQPALQRKLISLKQVGLDYVTLGQPANTLSGGESQRLKLAASLARRAGSHALFIMDEPTTGLHFADIGQLLECFRMLLSAGHSLLVIAHNLDLIKSADYVIDLGPEAGANGGRVVAAGTPEEICNAPESVTGRFLAAELGRSRA